MPITIQHSLERFVHQHYDSNRQAGREAESCANLLSDYLQFWSGLFQPDGMEDEVEPQQWERDLDDQMMQMLNGDTTPPRPDLGSLSLDQFDEEHLREFVGWYLLKDMALDSRMLQGVLGMLRKWIDFTFRQHGLSKAQYRLFIDVLNEAAPESERATIAAHALQKMVVSGGITPFPSSKVVCLLAVTARITVAQPEEPCTHWLGIDEMDEEHRLPVVLPDALCCYLQQGDVLQLCLAEYENGAMRVVESGALFPASTWVDAIMMDRFNPSDVMAEHHWNPLPEGVLLH